MAAVCTGFRLRRTEDFLAPWATLEPVFCELRALAALDLPFFPWARATPPAAFREETFFLLDLARDFLTVLLTRVLLAADRGAALETAAGFPPASMEAVCTEPLRLLELGWALLAVRAGRLGEETTRRDGACLLDRLDLVTLRLGALFLE